LQPVRSCGAPSRSEAHAISVSSFFIVVSFSNYQPASDHPLRDKRRRIGF
jgi:hypothetical protein